MKASCKKISIPTHLFRREIPGFSSYVEHTSALTQLLHEAIINHKDLTVVCLDQDNAYESIPHQLIQLAIHQYYIPDHSSNLIMNYFNNNNLRFARSRFTPTSFKKVLPQGCFIFVKLFVMIIKAANRVNKANTEICLALRHNSHHSNQHTRQMDPQGF